jgi:hypothetical protein
VEGQLALLLKALLLRRDLVVALHHNTLSEKLLLTTTAADLLKGVLGVVDETHAEGTETDLDKGTVVENLALDVEVGDVLLEMGHKHHVTSLVVLAVECKEVDLAQHGAGADDALALAEEVVAEDVDEGVGILGLGARGDDRDGVLANCLPAVVLEGLDDLGGLEQCQYFIFERNTGSARCLTYLEVDVFQAAHHNTVDAVL